MPTTSLLDVSKLTLDLKNFRTVPQKIESDAIKAMISIKPDRFFAVMESLIDDGYLPTENIIVLNTGTDSIVKEGNRRIAAMKLIHGLHNVDAFSLPTTLIEKVKTISSEWKTENRLVPCTIFTSTEEDKVDRVVTLAHGKGEKASRDPWNSVARARHNRDVKGATENGLDLLENYLNKGMNINNQQKERWGGDYPLTVLDEALRKCYVRMGFANISELVQKYPQNSFLAELETILLQIGLEQIKFETVRGQDFPTNYGIPSLPTPPPVTPSASQAPPNQPTQTPASTTSSAPPSNQPNTQSTTPPSGTSPTPPVAATPAPPAVAVNDPRHVASLLKKFAPRGLNRQKVVTLRDELRKLKIADNPIAFCLLLRSIFEISAKVYSTDNSLSLVKTGGKDKTLVELLRAITDKLTNNNTNTAMVRVFHGAMVELGKPEGILSVTSMNQLVHSTTFSITPTDICTVFSNIYPLLEAMN